MAKEISDRVKDILREVMERLSALHENSEFISRDDIDACLLNITDENGNNYTIGLGYIADCGEHYIEASVNYSVDYGLAGLEEELRGFYEDNRNKTILQFLRERIRESEDISEYSERSIASKKVGNALIFEEKKLKLADRWLRQRRGRKIIRVLFRINSPYFNELLSARELLRDSVYSYCLDPLHRLYKERLR